jgi:hypothetical protein
MSTPSHDGWSSPQQWDPPSADQGQPYGQPFDPTVSSPKQQPPPPGWEQGTWTQHGGSKTSEDNGRWLLFAIGVLVILIVAVAVALLVF